MNLTMNSTILEIRESQDHAKDFEGRDKKLKGK